MSLFQKPFSQKLLAAVLAICLVSLTAGPILLLPRKAQAAPVGCPVFDAALLAEETGETSLQTGWEALKAAYRTGNLTTALATTAELIWDSSQKLVEWTYDVLLNLLIHQILAMLTNDIVNWIQNGGTPRFLSMSLDDYLFEAADNAVGAFIDQYLGAGWLCEPFDLDIKLALADVPTFEEEVRCSLSDIVSNIEDFYEDFSEGGWKGWIELTKPQNNFYGGILIAQDKLMSVEEIAKKELEKDMEMGQGYLSPKDCTWYDANGNVVEEQKDVWGTPSLPASCQPIQPIDPYNPGATVGGFQGPCYKKCTILTPASSVNRMANEAITQYYKQLNAYLSRIDAGPYSVYIQAIVNALINKVITEGVGLLKADDESIPQSGDTGAAAAITSITDPTTAMQEQSDANSIASQLKLLETYTNDFLTEQKTNLAVLKSISDTYNNDVIPALDKVMTNCTSTYPSYATWAQGEKDNIENNLIPSYDTMIDQLENTDIPDTLSLISDIASSTSLVENFVSKVDDWLTIWGTVSGDSTDSNLTAAGTEMNNAKTAAIQSIQAILTTINGTYSSSDFSGLYSEIITAITNMVQAALDLEDERGNASWPVSGTFYGELEDAATLENDADTKANEC